MRFARWRRKSELEEEFNPIPPEVAEESEGQSGPMMADRVELTVDPLAAWAQDPNGRTVAFLDRVTGKGGLITLSPTPDGTFAVHVHAGPGVKVWACGLNYVGRHTDEPHVQELVPQRTTVYMPSPV